MHPAFGLYVFWTVMFQASMSMFMPPSKVAAQRTAEQE